MKTVVKVLKELNALGNPANVTGMQRFGIKSATAFGITALVLKQYAREVKKQAADRHARAQELWKTGNYEARAVAFLIDDTKQVTRKQMDAWAKDFDNWATVDGRAATSFAELRLLMKRRSSGRVRNQNSSSGPDFH
jgi:3-methyladenine DNA glycosylase AlkD